ncbi:MAG: hypothetical protein M1825_002952 [Sarcosagium campestre]|nr:MAG: hypothetical protein M1825_002952 [Sarcosagium campestre]
MSSDDMYFLDVLSSIPNDIRRYSLEVADSIDRHVESAATVLRETLSSSPWIPQSARPAPPPRPRQVVPTPSKSVLNQAQAWVSRNKVLTATIIFSIGAVVVYVHRRHNKHRKRRARRTEHAAKTEVVVIAGSPNEPICKSLALDLERRGFIIYVVVNTVEEEQLVQAQSRKDIRALNIDIIDPTNSQTAVDKFRDEFFSGHFAFSGSTPHHLHLVGVILLPDLSYPAGPIETTPPDLWSDALNVKILGTVATAQAFLPLITELHARLLVLTPSIIPSLTPPFHGIESSIVAALDAFTHTLAGELRPVGVDVCHFKLGIFDCGAVGGRHHLQTNGAKAARADVLSWPTAARTTYARDYVAQSTAPPRGSSLRGLHIAVFDALVRPRPSRVWHVGSGSLLYDAVGKWVPRGVIGWMLGIRSASNGDGFGEGSEVAGWEKVERL